LNPNAHQYKVRFHFISDSSRTWAGIVLDDIGWSMGPGTAVEDYAALPGILTLSQNYPNPFNPETNIDFSLPSRSNVRIEVFDILGRRVDLLLDEEMSAGNYSVRWNGTDFSGSPVSSGVYFYRVTTDHGSRQQKMTLLK
jgi:hypothetical protein